MHGRNAYLWAIFRRAPAGGWILPLPERGRAYGDGRTVKNDFSMDRDRSRAATGITFGILWALSVAHLFNDTLQSVIAAIYPMLKHDLTLSFAQIGLITLIYQLAGSVFQPLAGLYFDKRPSAWALPAGMAVTMFGLLGLAYASSFAGVLAMTALTGIGSSVFHPEASRLTSLASGGHRGLAQSLFQVGGNLGYALGPLLVAVLVAPYGRAHFAWFAVFALVAVAIMVPISRWYKRSFLDAPATDEAETVRAGMPLSLRRTVWAIAVLLVLIFSKYMYMAALTNYYTFYLIHKFGVTIGQSQILLFVFLAATAFGTMLGGPAGDRFGRKYVIWASILGTAPFSLAMPHVDSLVATVVLSFCAGLMLSSAFPAILVYAQELLPYQLGLVSGLFFGFAFGVAGIGAAVLGDLADSRGIDFIYNLSGFMPLIGLAAWFLPNLKK